MTIADQQFVTDVAGVGDQQRAGGQGRQQMDQAPLFAGCAFAQTPRPQQAVTQMDDGGQPQRGRRIGFAGLSHASLQLGRAWTLLARAVAAEGMKAAIEQAFAEEGEDAAAHPRGQGSQHGRRNADRRLEEAGTGDARPFASLITSDIPGPSRLEALGKGIAGAPGEGEQDEGEPMEIPARVAARGAGDGLGLPPDVGCEKLVEATEQRAAPAADRDT